MRKTRAPSRLSSAAAPSPVPASRARRLRLLGATPALSHTLSRSVVSSSVRWAHGSPKGLRPPRKTACVGLCFAPGGKVVPGLLGAREEVLVLFCRVCGGGCVSGPSLRTDLESRREMSKPGQPCAHARTLRHADACPQSRGRARRPRVTCRHVARAGRAANSKTDVPGQFQLRAPCSLRVGCWESAGAAGRSFLQGSGGSRTRASLAGRGRRLGRDTGQKRLLPVVTHLEHGGLATRLFRAHALQSPGPRGVQHSVSSGTQAGPWPAGVTTYVVASNTTHLVCQFWWPGGGTQPGGVPPSAGRGCFLARNPTEDGLSLLPPLAGPICLPVTAGGGSLPSRWLLAGVMLRTQRPPRGPGHGPSRMPS